MATATNTLPETPARGRRDSTERLARGLGWFSIALGTAELIAPGRLADALGLYDRGTIVGAYGVREIVNGIGLLAADNKAPWMSARIAGDALDLATLAAGFASDEDSRRNAGLALAAVAGVTVVDVLCREQLRTRSRRTAFRDYSDRSGFPRPADEMRGAARGFAAPQDMQTPEALRPYTT